MRTCSRLKQSPRTPKTAVITAKLIFAAIAEAAAADGFTVLLDGTNASDEEGDRPGMRALRELSVRSRSGECGLTKTEIRRLSKEAGLFTWDKPAYACLATRIPAGEAITAEKLAATEAAEDFLFSPILRISECAGWETLQSCNFRQASLARFRKQGADRVGVEKNTTGPSCSTWRVENEQRGQKRHWKR